MSEDYSSSTINIWPYYAKGNTSAAKEKGEQSLGQEEFLEILAAQLQNQDPMQPLEDKDFIAQMAQFSSVEQISKLTEETKWFRQAMGISSDLIGKSVSWEEWDSDGNLVLKSGKVESILFKDGMQHARIDGEDIPIDFVKHIWVGDPDTPPAGGDDDTSEDGSGQDDGQTESGENGS